MQLRIESEVILRSFENRWDMDTIKSMSLSQYVDINNQDTFCQWLETKTKNLGNIKGSTSIKFGIYKRKKELDTSRYYHDEEYTWVKRLGNDRNQAFKKIKNEILQVINAVKSGKFELIDNILLSEMFKWKIAYLYSLGQLVPIFSRDMLIKIATNRGLVFTKKIKTSKIQRFLMSKKPSYQSIFDYGHELWTKDNINSNKNKIKSTSKQRRKMKENTVYAQQIHSEIQNKFMCELELKYGVKKVSVEDNYVDIKVELDKKIILYEVKSGNSATECIRQALGQLLSNTFKTKTNKEKEIVVVGRFPIFESEEVFVTYIKDTLNINFRYEYIEI